jgi:aspartate aminotransferase-like enzyme
VRSSIPLFLHSAFPFLSSVVQYKDCETLLLQLLNASEGYSAAFMSGEAMVALWGVLKSCIVDGDHVVVLDNGVFGAGFVSMVHSVGGNVIHLASRYDEELAVEKLDEISIDIPIKMVIAVHCDTPSGILNGNLGDIGAWCKKRGALFAVDMVSSAFAVDIQLAKWKVDLAMVGTQKVLQMGPDLGIVAVSPRAWEVIRLVNYEGYDALRPFRRGMIILPVPIFVLKKTYQHWPRNIFHTVATGGRWQFFTIVSRTTQQEGILTGY